MATPNGSRGHGDHSEGGYRVTQQSATLRLLAPASPSKTPNDVPQQASQELQGSALVRANLSHDMNQGRELVFSGPGAWEIVQIEPIGWPDELLPVGQSGRVRVFWQRDSAGQLVDWMAQADPLLPAAFVSRVHDALTKRLAGEATAERRGCWTVRFNPEGQSVELEVHGVTHAQRASTCLSASSQLKVHSSQPSANQD